MRANDLLYHLDKVRQTQPGNWVACCPAHPDKSPSLAVRETDDGTILLHCFAGCGVEQILMALGMEMGALFPDKPVENGQPRRPPFPAMSVLRCIGTEALIVQLVAEDMVAGKAPNKKDMARLRLAHARIAAALDGMRKQ